MQLFQADIALEFFEAICKANEELGKAVDAASVDEKSPVTAELLEISKKLNQFVHRLNPAVTLKDATTDSFDSLPRYGQNDDQVGGAALDIKNIST